MFPSVLKSSAALAITLFPQHSDYVTAYLEASAIINMR